MVDDQDIRMPAEGANQHRLRNHNERLLMSMIQRHGALPGSDIARLAGLSPQTVSVILRKLEQEGLVEKGKPQRGKVGKPSVPIGLAPKGLHSVGLKIGRRTADLLLVNFVGEVIEQRYMTYLYPMPEPVFEFLEQGLADFRGILRGAKVDRIAGIGIAAPFELWNWDRVVGAPDGVMMAWKDLHYPDLVSRFTDLPVFAQNDATAACRAEHVFGLGKSYRNYAYFFLGSFIGGGVVMNDSVVDGMHGNAGAFGSLPVNSADGVKQLIDTASIHLLESAVHAAGHDRETLWRKPPDWSHFPEQLDPWIEAVSHQLAQAAVTVCAVLDFEAIVIDGAFPEDVKQRLVAEAARHLEDMDMRGIIRPNIVSGMVGANARAMGAACAPVFAQCFLDTNTGLGQSSFS